MCGCRHGAAQRVRRQGRRAAHCGRRQQKQVCLLVSETHKQAVKVQSCHAPHSCLLAMTGSHILDVSNGHSPGTHRWHHVVTCVQSPTRLNSFPALSGTNRIVLAVLTSCHTQVVAAHHCRLLPVATPLPHRARVCRAWSCSAGSRHSPWRAGRRLRAVPPAAIVRRCRFLPCTYCNRPCRQGLPRL